MRSRVQASVAELAVELIDAPRVEIAQQEVLPVDPGMIPPIPFLRPKEPRGRAHS
jgi:hypothetical protein